MLASYLGFDFIDAADVIYIDKYGRYDEKKTDAVFSLALSEHDYAVVPGFYGQLNDESDALKPSLEVVVMLLVVSLRKCACADLLRTGQMYRDSLLRIQCIVKDPKPIATITYKELRELSYMGASVSHQNSIFPVRNEGIPILIKNTNSSEDAGTLIVESICHKPDHVITGIAGKTGFATVMIEKDMMNSEIGFGRKVLQVFEEHGLSFEHMPQYRYNDYHCEQR